ncbi:MAG TPA: hypothetical protein VFZ65_04600 [Planctomycetota bacterium]|nr:hypothetical protein [Planctomycetota bacterium]
MIDRPTTDRLPLRQQGRVLLRDSGGPVHTAVVDALTKAGARLADRVLSGPGTHGRVDSHPITPNWLLTVSVGFHAAEGIREQFGSQKAVGCLLARTS